jgi:hypothetical protein
MRQLILLKKGGGGYIFIHRMFDLRRDSWRLHFRWDGVRVVGITSTGRATVMALHMNRPLALAIREEEAHRGRHPPQTHR